jgi:hypothetical protein
MAHEKGQFYGERDGEGGRGNERGEMKFTTYFMVGELSVLYQRFQREAKPLREPIRTGTGDLGGGST